MFERTLRCPKCGDVPISAINWDAQQWLYSCNKCDWTDSLCYGPFQQTLVCPEIDCGHYPLFAMQWTMTTWLYHCQKCRWEEKSEYGPDYEKDIDP